MQESARRQAARRQPITGGLPLSKPGDTMEVEADRIAERVMANTGMIAVSTSSEQVARACCSGCTDARDEDEAAADDAIVQRRSDGGSSTDTAPAGLMSGLGAGHGLEHGVRGFMEQRFDHDFGDVRVHHGTAATAAAESIDAVAFTVGDDIVFRDGAYQPDTDDGRSLIAHELAHTVQQRGVGRRVQRFRVLRPMPPVARPPLPPVVEPLPLPPVVEPLPLPPQLGPSPGPWLPGPWPGPFPGPIIGPYPDPALGPQPQPQPGQPQPGDPKPDPECGSPELPHTQIRFGPGPAGQGKSVVAEPLTKCPGIWRGSPPSPLIYADQFDCIADAGETYYWVRAHLLHGRTSRPSSVFNLHGPGNLMANLIITDKSLNGAMNRGAELPAINRIYGPNREVLWYEANVDSYVHDLDYFAQQISVRFGSFDPVASTRGSQLGGGTFTLARVPPHCPAMTSELPMAPVVPDAAQAPTSDYRFQSTFDVCLEELASRTFEVTDGGLEVQVDSRWTTASGEDAEHCPAGTYTLVLEQEGTLWGWNTVTETVIDVGKPIRPLRWTRLENDTYRLRFLRTTSSPGCCLSGDVYVGTFSAPRDAPLEA